MLSGGELASHTARVWHVIHGFTGGHSVALLAKVSRDRGSLALFCCVGGLGERGWGSREKEGMGREVVLCV